MVLLRQDLCEQFFDDKWKRQNKTYAYVHYLSTELSAKYLATAKSPAIDLGCGDGRLTIPLLQRGIACTAVDISQKALDNIYTKAAKLRRNLTLYKANLAEVTITGYESISCASTLHYCTDKDVENLIHQISSTSKTSCVYISFECDISMNADSIAFSFEHQVQRSVQRARELLKPLDSQFNVGIHEKKISFAPLLPSAIQHVLQVDCTKYQRSFTLCECLASK